jgi:putative two-component system response regulator
MSQKEMPLGTILVADDSEDARELLSHLLISQGYRVICAEDGAQALSAISSQPVDVAVLDVMMPRHTGFAVCQAVKARPETRLIPVVLVTGLASSDDRIQGIKNGADDFLSKPIRKEELLARVASLVRLKHFTDELESAEAVLCSLARSIEAKDPSTVGHCDRLARYAVAMGERLGLPREQCVALRRAGIVHDIGKVVVPEHILLKPGPLDPRERRLLESHPVVGERICAPLKSFRLVLPIIRHHHEKMDGTGYPDRLSNGRIPLTARILQIVDVYDALTMERPYRQALSSEEAFFILREEARKGWRDAALVDQFEELLATSSTAAEIRPT